MEQRIATTESLYRGRVAWVDTDAGGRIHHTAAFRWAEIAEHSLFRRIRPGFEAAVFPRRSVEATYHSTLVFDDEFEVLLWVGSVGRTSVTFVWEVHSGGVVCVKGRHTAVHVDAEGKPAPLPAWLRKGLEKGAHQVASAHESESSDYAPDNPGGRGPDAPDEFTEAVT